MLFSALALAAAAVAAPLARRADAPTAGTAFTLVAKVTSGTDFADAPVNNAPVVLYHTGAAANRVVVSSAAANVPVFYQNGTQAEADAWTARLVNDTPSFPQGFLIDFEGPGTDSFDVYVNAGPGSQSIMVSPSSKPRAFIDRHGLADAAGTFVVCQDETLGNVLSWKTTDGAPEGCVAVDLVPQCAALPDLPAGATWSHDNVQEVRCYADAAAVGWE
jgi:hypothetical protein